MKKKSQNNSILIIILIIVICFCVFQIVNILLEYRRGEQTYDNIANLYIKESEETEDPFPDIDIDVDGLLEENEDFVAWIYYEDGVVNYPIVKETYLEINKYLKTTFEGTTNSAGCIFIPYDASENFDYYNTIVYGHNMKNGSMFGSLKLMYRDKTNITDPYIYVWTKNHEKIMYRVISLYIVENDSEMYLISTKNSEQKSYLEQTLSLGSINNIMPFTDEENEAIENCNNMITLSTCYGASGTSKRLLVQGIEILRMSY